ncbi:MAG: 2-oxoacid:acceptor oxidoreductase subunit alpha [Desulfobacterales bacterium]
MENSPINILISGEAGQGLQTVGQLFAKCLIRCGFSVHTDQTFESRIRGGYSTFVIRTGDKKVLAPSEPVDLALPLNEGNLTIDRPRLRPHGLMIGNDEWHIDDSRFVAVPFQSFGKKRYWNTAGIGVLSAVLGMDLEIVSKAVKERFEADVAAENVDILKTAFRWAEEKPLDFKKLTRIETLERKWMMNCHEAVAFGAISGGIKFCAYYPMSPSTSIPITLVAYADALGLIVEQVEDEICALNMAIGASYCGAPAMVATSGGGFALMTEALSLAAATETPVVIVVAQRPGPATGLPTRTEQGDLQLVLYGGHGEFPRAVFAPSNAEDCFHITRHAVEMAEKYQIPAILLTDHHLSSSYQDMSPPDAANLPFVRSGTPLSNIQEPYWRYRLTETGVSPRLLPGQSRHLVIADSHEHSQDGHISEDLRFRPKLVEKRLKKGRALTTEILPPEYTGTDNPDILLVTWGSTRGAALEAAQKLQDAHTSVGCLNFTQLWPMNPDHFFRILTDSKRVVGIEGNATGQLCRLIRQETGFHITKRICRYDGLSITPEFILESLDH